MADWVLLPENRAAYAAAVRVADCLAAGDPRPLHNPLFLHGAPGTGKSQLVQYLIGDLTRRRPDALVTYLAAREFVEVAPTEKITDEPPSARESAHRADLVILEDLQHLPASAAERVTALLDRCLARGRQVVTTATEGPGRLTQLPARLTSRLAAGLVVGLWPLNAASRRAYFQDRLTRFNLRFDSAVLDWLAQHCQGSVRHLEGALARLKALTQLHGQPPTLDAVVANFQEEARARRLTVDRIARQVGTYFQVETRCLKSRRRTRDALLPRQVGMYLARRLTALSLDQIGEFFGGRDHSTVLHACRKVEDALAHDVALSCVVRQLLAEVA